MVFTLVSSAQEWLNVRWDDLKKLREERAIIKEQEAEEAERVSNILYISFLLDLFIPMSPITQI